MADSRMREDVESAYLDITEFTGQSLTGPRELITRRVLCSNPVQTMTDTQAGQVGDHNGATHAVFTSPANNNLQQLNFRLLSTSPGAMLNAKVVLTLPLVFHHCRAHTGAALARLVRYETDDATANVGHPGFCAVALADQIAPRRNGILKACRSISTTINSTVSFTVRPDECVDVMEQMFTQPGVGGRTGTYSQEEDGSWGNCDGLRGALPDGAGGIVANSLGGFDRVRNIFSPAGGAAGNANHAMMVNKGFMERRADFRSGAGGGGMSTFDPDGGGRGSYCKYEYKTTLCIPPFKTFNKDIYSRSATWIPYADSIDLMLNFKATDQIKAALLQCASLGEGRNTVAVQDYDFAFYDQPSVSVEWCVPPVALRPSYTLPCWRNQHYSQRITLGADDATKQITFQGIRLDALPSLISLHVTDGPTYKKMDGAIGGDLAWANRRYNWTEYFGAVSDFSITINEKISVLSDKSNYDLYKLYRMYAPDSKMSYTVWRELRQLILVRSDVLAVDKGQSVFNPTNLTLNCRVGRPIQFRRSQREIIAQGARRVWDAEVRLNFWYFNDALTLSQQAAAVTSMLLSPSDVQQLRVSPEAKEIQTLMEMGLQG